MASSLSIIARRLAAASLALVLLTRAVQTARSSSSGLAAAMKPSPASTAAAGAGTTAATAAVRVFHLIDNALWGNVDGSAVQGHFPCSPRVDCVVYSSDSRTHLLETLLTKFRNKTLWAAPSSTDATGVRSPPPRPAHMPQPVTVALYNIHTWSTLSRFPHAPDVCRLPTDLTMAESEESFKRFRRLFTSSFPLFDGNSTTSPYASVQRSYVTSLNVSAFLPLKAFRALIRGSAFVASTCHRGKDTTNREQVVAQLDTVFRVDSLGKCKKTRARNDTVTLRHGKTALDTLLMKQRAISNYMFYLAFENTIEPGYVTEKVMDALIAGVVPVYLGSSEDCKKLLPHPKAAIFLDDFRGDAKRLGAYLQRLAANETAYEEHRAWRRTFDPVKQSPLLLKSWPCSVCEWGLNEMATRRAGTRKSPKRKMCDAKAVV
jgi:Glycosyltransferase family 10 (fucosyltransferase) C-term